MSDYILTWSPSCLVVFLGDSSGLKLLVDKAVVVLEDVITVDDLIRSIIYE